MGLLDQFQSMQWAMNPTIVPEQRGTFLPASIPPHVLGTQPPAQAAVPGLIHAPWQAFQSLWQAAANERGGGVPNDQQNARDAFDVAGAATTGGLLAPKPTGILGSAGGKPGFTAYHGSPHDFDRFSLDKIGTGEGAQAYGHGLYFADQEATAAHYKTAGPSFFAVKEGPSSYRVELDPLGSQQHQFEPVRGLTKEQADALVAEQSAKYNGKLYQVRINADPQSFLDYDAPLSSQSPSVRAAVDKVAGRPLPGDMTGRDAWDRAWTSSGDTYMGAGAKASERLREAGIPGIRYLDQGSRDGAGGSRNTVVFDDSLIEIMKKYGLLGPAYLGAQALSGGDEQPQGLIK